MATRRGDGRLRAQAVRRLCRPGANLRGMMRESAIAERAARNVCLSLLAGFRRGDPATLRIMKRIMEME